MCAVGSRCLLPTVLGRWWLISDLSTGIALIRSLKNRAAAFQREAYALSIAIRDRRVPWYARVLMALVLAHTFSPIDLIPDFIPVLGVLDDLIITPLGIALVLKMIPAQVMVEARQQAQERMEQRRPVSRAGAIMTVGIWLVILAVVGWSVARLIMR